MGHPWALPCRHNAMEELLQDLAKLRDSPRWLSLSADVYVCSCRGRNTFTFACANAESAALHGRALCWASQHLPSASGPEVRASPAPISSPPELIRMNVLQHTSGGSCTLCCWPLHLLLAEHSRRWGAVPSSCPRAFRLLRTHPASALRAFP